MFAQTFPIIAPVFICAFIGWVWQRRGGTIDTVAVGALITQIGAPCLIISSLVSAQLQTAALSRIALACFTVLALMAILVTLALKIGGLDRRIYFTPLMFANVGNMGLPLCLFAFGDQGLALGVAWFMANSILHFSVGTVMVSGKGLVKTLATNPIIWAVLISTLLIISQYMLPLWLRNTVELLGAFAIPLMLILLGVSLSQLRLRHLKTAFILSVLRLAGGFACGLAVVEFYQLEGVMRGIVLIQSSMPVAVFNYIFAKQYHRGEEEVAALVMMSTVISFLSLPWLIKFAL